MTRPIKPQKPQKPKDRVQPLAPLLPPQSREEKNFFSHVATHGLDKICAALPERDRLTDINKPLDENGCTLLHWAARNNAYADLVRALLKIPNTNPLAKNAQGLTPLEIALRAECWKSAAALVEGGGPIRESLNADGQARLPLLHGLLAGRTLSSQALTQILRTYPEALFEKDRDGNTILHTAVLAGNEKVIALFCNHPALALSAKNAAGYTAVQLAATLDNLESMRGGGTEAILSLLQKACTARGLDPATGEKPKPPPEPVQVRPHAIFGKKTWRGDFNDSQRASNQRVLLNQLIERKAQSGTAQKLRNFILPAAPRLKNDWQLTVTVTLKTPPPSKTAAEKTPDPRPENPRPAQAKPGKPGEKKP